MELIKGYIYTNSRNQIVFSKIRMPCQYWESPSKGHKTQKGYKKAIKDWKNSFINVLHAYYHRNKEVGSSNYGSAHIIINSNKNDTEVLDWGNECMITLEDKGAKVVCHKFMGSWTTGHGVFADTPEKAIKLYEEYVEWLKLYHKNPKLFPPAKFSEH